MNWIERYGNLATATHKPHILLHDRDNLLTLPPLRAYVEQLGSKLLTAETRWQVRTHYEQHARGRLERILLIVPAHYQPLPDMVADTYSVAVGLRELFPQLDASMLSGLSAQALDSISIVSHYQRLEKETTLKWLIEYLYN